MFIARDNREKLEKPSTLLIRVNLKQTLDFNVAKWYDFLAPKLPTQSSWHHLYVSLHIGWTRVPLECHTVNVFLKVNYSPSSFSICK